MKYFPTLSLISMEMIELLLTNNYNAAAHLITLIYTPVRVQGDVVSFLYLNP